MRNILFIFVFLFGSLVLFSKKSINNQSIHNCLIHTQEKDKKSKHPTTQTLIEFGEDERPINLERFKVSADNLFVVHYTLNGANAVDPTDKDQNGHPDYVDSVAFYCDYVHNIYINEMGFSSPIPDNGEGAEGDLANLYDIYLWELGNSDDPSTYNPDSSENYHDGGIYGFTFGTEEIPNDKSFRTHSFVIIDNNFSPTDSVRIITGPNEYQAFKAYFTTGWEAMKITIAHEYHHSIQSVMGIEENSSWTMTEMTSVFMEKRIFEESLDYVQYVNQLFGNLHNLYFGKDDPFVGYSHSIFAQYIYENYGDTPILRLWQMIGEGTNGYFALDDALQEQGSSMQESWMDFLRWLYNIGTKNPERKTFSNHTQLPKLEFLREQNFVEPSFMFNGSLAPFEFAPVRIIFEGDDSFVAADTLGMIITNIDIQSAGRRFGHEEELFSFSLSNDMHNNFKKLNLLDYYYFLDRDEELVNELLIEYPGTVTQSIDYAFPNPYSLSQHNTIFIPVPENTPLSNTVKAVLYNSDMSILDNFSGEVGINNGKRVLAIDLTSYKLSNGVYFFESSNGDESVIGKFAVVNTP